MNNTKLFNSIDNHHQIEITTIDDISWFNINKLDYPNYKTFLILLKDVIKYLSDNEIKFIKQYIRDEDLDYFKNSSYLDIGDNKYVITTNIINFLPEITNALGIQKL